MNKQERIAEIEEELKYFEIDPEDYEEQYRESLNEFGEVQIGNMSFEPARVVEELDPIAYRCGLNDYVDGLDVEDDPKYQELVEELEGLKSDLENTE